MSIQFTQYLRPNGKKTEVSIERPEYIETLADEFTEKGGYFECEELSTGHASFTAGHPSVLDGDIAIEVVMNGPDVPEAVDRLVHKAHEWMYGCRK